MDSTIASDGNKSSAWRSLVTNEWPAHGSYQNPPRVDDYPRLERQPTVLGVHDGHTASACILKQGKVVAAVEEERLTRVKNQTGFPFQSIQHCLDIAGIGVEDIDLVAWGTEFMSVGSSSREDRKKAYLGQVPFKLRLRRWLAEAVGRVGGRRVQLALRARVHRQRRTQRLTQIARLGIDPAKVHFVEHHQCHAATAYYGWGRFDQDALVLTNDGQGDGLCGTVSVGSQGRMYRLAEISQEHSFGNLYGMVTFILGMVPLEHEFKLMGMAPYSGGPRQDAVRDLFWSLFEDDPANPLGWRKKPGVRPVADYKHIRDLLELQRFDNVCGGLQEFTEEILVRWVGKAIEKTGVSRVCGAGGVFMNVKANKVVMELSEVDDFFVFPSCADETICIGAAYQVAADYHNSHSEAVAIEPIREMYLGRDYSDEVIRREIGNFEFDGPVEVIESERIEEEVAQLLASGEVVARFSGREEFGARALGNRSLLADPRSEETKRIINEMIKQRDFWMPFAMSVLPERTSDYYRNDKQIDAPYMILTFDCHLDRIDEIRAAIHPYDQTSRPQVVHQEWNPSYYRVLKEYESLTGHGAVLNTSFNLHGFPLVSHPKDALDVFKKSGLKNLAIGSYLVRKRAASVAHDDVQQQATSATVAQPA